MKKTHTWTTDDGMVHQSAEAAREHEDKLAMVVLSAADEQAFEGMIAGKVPELEAAFRRVANRLYAGREIRGEVRRRKAAA